MMLFTGDLAIQTGPPPQAILDQRKWWRFLIFLLAATCILQVIGLDLGGALLSGLMLFFSVIITRDGMQELGRYALIFAILCCVNFVFDLLPLLFSLGGRSESMITADPSAPDPEKETYTITTQSHPFFDKSQGLSYNMLSIAMVCSPLTMVAGAFLGFAAHHEMQAAFSFNNFFDDGTGADAGNLGNPARAFLGAGPATSQLQRASAQYGTLPGQGQAPARPVNAFEGTSYKLG